jgi:hypothetical protein
MEDVFLRAEDILTSSETVILRLRDKLFDFYWHLDAFYVNTTKSYILSKYWSYSFAIDQLSSLFSYTKMPSFACSSNSSDRDFSSYKKWFHDIGLFHQNYPSSGGSGDENPLYSSLKEVASFCADAHEWNYPV